MLREVVSCPQSLSLSCAPGVMIDMFADILSVCELSILFILHPPTQCHKQCTHGL